jgi:hypothetical protein
MSASIDISAVEARFSKLAPQAMDEGASLFSELYDIFPKVPATGAKGPEWLLRTDSHANANSFDVGGPLPAPDATTKIQLSTPYANYGATISITDKAMREADLSTSTGQAQIMGYLADEVDQARMALAAKLNTDTITNQNVAKALVGFHGTNSVINDTGTLYGQSRSTYPALAPVIYDNSSTPRPLTVELLNASWGNFVNVVKAQPGQWVILCDYLQGNKLEEVTTGASISEKAVQGVTAEQILGRTSTWYKGIPVVVIPGYTSSRVDFVNVTSCSYESLSGGFSTIPTENTGDTFLFKIVNYLSFRMRNPRHSCFGITDLN